MRASRIQSRISELPRAIIIIITPFRKMGMKECAHYLTCYNILYRTIRFYTVRGALHARVCF